MTGTRGTADNIMAAAQGAMKTMQLEDGQNFIAVTTDNPSVMQAFRSKCQEKYFWVLAFACFLHQMNTIIGEICAFPSMKQIIKQANRVVTFFNSSHYWGGQLKEEAKKCHVNRGLKKNCETRFYALSLQAQSSRTPLSHTCLRPDAQKKEKGLSPVAADVVETVLHDRDFWPPMLRVATEEGDDAAFLLHAWTVFNRRFHSMNMNIHSLALFLHPLCRKLAINEAAKGRSLQFMVDTALGLAKQWRWSKEQATRLAADVKHYYQSKAPFTGGGNDGLVNDLDKTFTWKPPFSTAEDDEDVLAGPEDISLDEFDTAFDELDKTIEAEHRGEEFLPGEGILNGKVYDFEELAKVDNGEVPTLVVDNMDVIGTADDDDWDILAVGRL
ncbi:hypothetical protein BU17DRAFT_88214 [Hysterangium stoloniferum]|nr:hypothetical protein BU17DRAFT_88214 [Hysterangium stoloniferum]